MKSTKNNRINLYNKKHKKKFIQHRKTPLYKTLNVFTASSKILCTTSDSLVTVNGASTILFAAAAQSYYNFLNLKDMTDFTDQSSDYYFFQIKGITVDIIRTVDEATMYSKANGSTIFIAAFPNTYSDSTSFAALARNQTSYKIDTLTFDRQTVYIPMLPLQVFSNSYGDGLIFDLSKPIPINMVNYIPGQLSVNWSNTNNNNSVVPLFSLQIKYHITFINRK